MATNKLIMILGMHRSGTSLLASLLQKMGIHLGERFVPADNANPAGYWENIEVVAIHDQLLSAMGREWMTAAAALPYPSNWWLDEPAQKARQDLTALARQELENGSGVWAFKDPRTCRLLPLWKQVIADLGCQAPLEPVYLLSTRSPRDVAASLARRDGLAPEMAELLWLWHYFEPIAHLKKNIRGVFSYEYWFKDPDSQLLKLIDTINVKSSIINFDLLKDLFRDELRHQCDGGASSFASVAMMEELLSFWREHNKPPREFSEIISHISSALELSSAWGHVIASEDPLRLVRDKQIEISRLEAKVYSLSNDLEIYKDNYDKVYRSYETASHSYEVYKNGYDEVYSAYKTAAHDFEVYRDAHDRLQEAHRQLSETLTKANEDNHVLSTKINLLEERLNLIREDITSLSKSITRSLTWRLGQRLTFNSPKVFDTFDSNADERRMLLNLIKLYEAPGWELTGPFRILKKRRPQ